MNSAHPQPFPPAAAPRRSWLDRVGELWLAAVLVMFTAFVAAVFVIDRAGTQQVGVIADDPGAVYAEADAVSAAYTLSAADGVVSSGWMAVTADGYAEQSILDGTSGSATVRSTPDGTAVWGDAGWWGRRAPGRAAGAAGTWVQPDDGLSFPIDITTDLTPAALAELIRSIDEEGAVDPAVTTYQGIPVIASTYLDWTLIRTDTLPSEVLLLTGPIHSGMFRSAAAADTDLVVVPAVDGAGAEARPYGSLTGGESIAIQPARLDQSGADTVRSAASSTVAGESTAPPSADPDSAEAAPPADAVPPPPQADLPTGQPAFEVEVNASYCDTPTCTWSAAVTNTGTAAGSAVVEVSATPGMGPQRHDLGVIQPGQTASTPTLSMANQAPTPAPGQTTSVTVNYAAVVYSRELHGDDEDKYRRLADRLGTAYQYWLDSIMGMVDAAMKPAVLDTVERMLDEEVAPESALTSAEWASSADPGLGDYSPLPVQSRLAGYGDRFRGWSGIAGHQSNLFADDYALYQAGLDAALRALADPAEPTVSFLPRLDADGRITAVEIISDSGDPATSRCEIVTGDGGRDAGAAAADALSSMDTSASSAFADAVANGCPVSVTIEADPNPDLLTGDASPNALTDTAPLGEQLQDGLRDSGACTGTGPALDQVTVSNQVGRSTWSAGQLCGTATASVSTAQLDLLNGLLAGTDLLGQLKARGAVTVDEHDRITDVVWRDPDEECTSAMRQPVYAPAKSAVAPSNTATRNAGDQAQGAWVYLCGGSYTGGTPASSSIEPWDWPTSNPGRASQGQRSRCHLIANTLGGSGTDVANLVTCFQRANNDPYMKRAEQIVRRLSRNQDIFYLVKPQYDGNNGSLKGIRIVAIGNKGLDLDLCVRNSVLGGLVFNGPC
ncbi:DNA/RNA non-specific endonuclease [Glycomyces terrestris]|uniref:Type VII secretion system protein EssD-like domain-containing protein n=1 Tax=Glycomyces terrestris TaxID=2493553 RepID=A0A426V0S3_9ACTN|nr:DNA/RNA non-specific endonuclease [Glycomyces terrestris]RRS00446.1 hypothetical protein EIW28_07730 [Glycomyces terrestris]